VVCGLARFGFLAGGLQARAEPFTVGAQLGDAGLRLFLLGRSTGADLIYGRADRGDLVGVCRAEDRELLGAFSYEPVSLPRLLGS
jgi:hypothetical protein